MLKRCIELKSSVKSSTDKIDAKSFNPVATSEISAGAALMLKSKGPLSRSNVEEAERPASLNYSLTEPEHEAATTAKPARTG